MCQALIGSTISKEDVTCFFFYVVFGGEVGEGTGCSWEFGDVRGSLCCSYVFKFM